MDELSGKVAVVTGGASGIGLAMVRAFLAEGMRVVLADIEADALGRAVAELPDGADVEPVVCDVSVGAEVDALRDRAVERFGTVHVVCNNAGVSAGAPVWEHTVEDWEWVLGANLWGVVHGIRAFTPLLIEQGEGHIVNTASMAGFTSMPFSAIYNVSKHAVVTLSETLFADLALAGSSGVGVSVLCPGWVQTRIHEAGRNRPDAAEPVAETDPQRAALRAGFADYIAGVIASGIDPADVASLVVDAVKADRFYILTHPEWAPMITSRTERIARGENPRLPSLP